MQIKKLVEILRRYKYTRMMIDIYEKNKIFILYLFFGGVTTLVNILTYALFAKVLSTDYMVSNIIAWITGVSVAYFTNKIYVFESKSVRKSALLRELTTFFIARLLTLLIDMFVMYIGISIFKFNDIIIKIIANIIVIFSNYFLSKYIIFKSQGK